MVNGSQAFVFVVFCALVVGSDLLFRRVFNWLILVGLLLKLGWLVFGGTAPEGLTSAWASAGMGLLLALLFLVPLYVFKAMGAGDVKFFAVLGFWMEPTPLVIAWLLGSGMAGIHAVVSMVHRNHPLGTWADLQLAGVQERIRSPDVVQRMASWVAGIRAGRAGIPYAAYLALGAIWALYST
ncbi:A24 family peptidase [Pigmentiphaga kullae]|uniref:Prepilin peptidase CpaA n=1 Tax=Pigmentiphaga kullae TaxID=151784 RepID=A0A4Q7NF50_9BURK|nr:prepilin peptidase [Pigmentiphaga kullae]RZS81639.1 prepilin peptidase CpaA [Pigmentiphaga kullae]